MKTREGGSKEEIELQQKFDGLISTYMATNDEENAKKNILEKSLYDKARDNFAKK